MKKLFMVFFCVLFSLSAMAQDGGFSLTGMDQQGIYNTISSLKGAHENKTMGSAGLAIGTSSKAKVKIVNTTPYVIDGVYYSKSAAEIAFTATTHDFTAPAGVSHECYYVYSINTAGTVTVTKGDSALVTYADLPDYADLPSDQAIIGYIKIIINGGQTFDASTTELDNSTVIYSVTYTNTSVLKKMIGPRVPKVTVDFIQK